MALGLARRQAHVRLPAGSLVGCMVQPVSTQHACLWHLALPRACNMGPRPPPPCSCTDLTPVLPSPTSQFGLYEYFKKTYSDMAGPEAAKKYQVGGSFL